MKKIISIILILSAQYTMASCYSDVLDQYLDSSRGTRFDYMPKLHKPVELEQGEVFPVRRNSDIGPFDASKLVFVVTGSIHSGWFSQGIVVDPQTCEIEQVSEIDSE
ncbi:hypothetical protein [Halobacteriovorax sp. HLS]|uniref:hypothetical protein n=1 Tax=Halobacteriovorax sp. HLS TaxID=2234000 RepID=UPI000FD9341D|nr:hypothetical protein [Halobacteriovorax sp. HLS]